MADNELQKKLQHRQGVNEGSQPPSKVHQSVYSEFKEFSIPEIKEYKKTFQKYDVDKSNFIDFMELKMMMEKLGEPQTHLALKDMIKAVDEDCDGQISFREFMLIFKKAKTGELQVEGLKTIAATCDVTTEGVGGAKNFFEAKVKQQSDSAQFEQQIKAEQEQKKLEQEEAQAKRAAFKEKASMWK